jgi:N-methylhydantoinase B
MKDDVIFGEIIREYFETVAAEMNAVMDRTAMSPIFNEAHDCSAGVFAYNGEEVNLVARAMSEPVHIFASLTSVEGVMDYYRNDLHPGDVIIVNDPYAFGTHSADWTVVRPVFHKGRPVFFPGVRGHIIEHGAPVAGGLSPHNHDIWQESIRFQPIKLYARGEPQQDVFRWLRANNRQPLVMEGDLRALMGACVVAERRILEIIDKYGYDRVAEGVAYVLDYSERRVRAAIRSWPDGEYFGQALADTDYNGQYDLNIDCTLKVEGDALTANFTGTHSQGGGHVNSTPGNTGSWVFTALSAILPDVPINSGFFRPVAMVLPEGTLVNGTSPASVATNTINIGSTIGDAVMKAFEHVVPESVGSVAADLTITMHLGEDSRYPDRPFFVHVDYLMSAVTASGAHGVDGWGGWSALHCSHRMPTIEMTEVQIPVLYRRAEYEVDTAAPGKWRGVPAFVVERENPEHQYVVWMICVQSNRNPLPGWYGGEPGVPSVVTMDLGGENESLCNEYAVNHLTAPGERLRAVSGGGGGWGPAVERDPAAVLEDVLDEYVSVEVACERYGVVVSGVPLAVDATATAQLRLEMAAAR